MAYAYETKQMDEIRERMRKLVEYTGLSRNAFARKAEITQSNFCSAIAEHPKSNISKKSVKDIATTYGVSLKWLEDGIGEMFDAPSAEELMVSYDSVFNKNGNNSPNNTQIINEHSRSAAMVDKLLMMQLKEKDKEIERLNNRIDKLLDIINKLGGD